ncbi:GLUG motif-containing protein [Natronorubrum sp. DTA28]|uniref:GLUG motif-containing protein n=1 Tax=Natronorubrum sp. DTA28 TaxID=3447019 RepID=UPI003F87CF4D
MDRRPVEIAGSVLAMMVLVGLGIVFASGGVVADTDGPADLEDIEGEGTEEAPYVITDVLELQAMNDDPEAHYELGGDIDASETEDWNDGEGFEPISSFAGEFDGQHYTIAGLVIDRPDEERVGLFGSTEESAEIRDVRLESADVTGGGDSEDGVGSVVGNNNGTVSNSSAAADVTGSDGVGGLVGYNVGTVRNSAASGTVSGEDQLGGLVGRHDGEVRDSYATGEVSGENQLGGLVGRNNGEVRASHATGEVSGRNWIGGLVGYNMGEVRTSYATGAASGSQHIGGLVGMNFGQGADANVSDAYATGAASGNQNIGALVGLNDFGSVSDAYAIGEVSGNYDVGGLVGNDVALFNPSSEGYWDSLTTGQSTSEGGTDLTTPEMTGDGAKDYMDLDFEETWMVLEADPAAGNARYYPTLQDNPQDPAPSADGWGERYEVEDWYDLDDVRDNLEAWVVLKTDLDDETAGYDDVAGENANGGDGFEPIANFAGEFDGQNNTISELVIDRPDEERVGLFGSTGGFTEIRDVHLENVDVTGEGGQDENGVGSVVGLNRGTLENVSMSGDVDGYRSVGGLVGANDGGTLSHTSSSGSVTGESREISGETRSSENVGGLVGANDGTIVESFATGDIDGQRQVGGLVGDNDGDVSGSYATGEAAAAFYYAGGLVGYNDGDVSGSYATGEVSALRWVGGLVGSNRGEVRESYATGDATASEYFVGGLVGENRADVSKSYATGSVSGAERNAGGLLGTNWGEVRESYATGDVTGDDRVGGLVGWNDGGDVTDTYWDDEVATVTENGDAVAGQGIGDGGGDATALTTPDMSGLTAIGAMDGLEFPDGDGTWHVTHEYPALAWEDTDPVYEVAIEETNSPIVEGEPLEVTATVTNWGSDGERAVELRDFEGIERATETLSLESGDVEQLALEWETVSGDAGDGDVTVESDDDHASATVEIKNAPLETVAFSEAEYAVGQGAALEVDLEDAVDTAGGSFDGEETLVFTLDPFGESTILLVDFDDGEATGLELLDGSETASLSAETGCVGVDVLGQPGSDESEMTIEPVMAAFDVAEDVTIEQGEPLEIDVENAEDKAGDAFDGEADLVGDVDGHALAGDAVAFTDGEASEVPLLEGESTAAITAGTYEGVTLEADEASDTLEITVESVLDAFTVADATIEQGETLAVDFESAEDKAGDAFDGTVDLTGDDIDGHALSPEDVTFDEGEAIGVELLEADSTADTSAGTYDVTLQAGDASDSLEITVESVLAAFSIADVTIEQGETLELDLEDAIDNAGDEFVGEASIDVGVDSLEGIDESVERTVAFDDGAADGLEVLSADDTAGVSAGEYSTLSADAVDEAVSETFNVTVGAVLATFDVTASEDPIDQGASLKLDVTDAEDRAGDAFTGTVDLSVADIDGKNPDTTAVSVSEGAASEIELFDGDTPTLSAGVYEEIDVTAADATGTFSITIDAVLAEFALEDVTIPRGDPLDLSVSDAVDLAGAPYDRETTVTVRTSDIDGVDDDRVHTVQFAGEDDVELTNVLDGETTERIDAGTHPLVVSADAAEVAADLIVEQLAFDLEETTSPVIVGDTLEVLGTASNPGSEPITGTVSLSDTDFDGAVQDTVDVSLEPGDSTDVTLSWGTDEQSIGSGTVTVSTGTDEATERVTVKPDPAITDGRSLEHAGDYWLTTNLTESETVLNVSADDVTIDGKGYTINTTAAGDAGLRIDDGQNVTVTNLTVIHAEGEFALEIGDGAVVAVDELTVGTTNETTPETTVSFTGTGLSIGASPPPGTPSGLTSVGQYFEAEPTGHGELRDLELEYDELGTLDAGTVSLWKMNSSGTWSELEHSSIDTEAGVVTANTTSFSTFGAFGEERSSGTATPARFELGAVELDRSVSVSDGALERVTVDVTNSGSRTGTAALEFRIEETVRATETVRLRGGLEETVEFTDVHLSDMGPGTYNYTVAVGDDDRHDGQFTITSGVVVTGYELTPAELAAGDQLDRVVVDVENTDNRTVTTDIVFSVDGDAVVTERGLEIEANGRVTRTYADVDVSHLEPGAYEYSIRTADAVVDGTLTVIDGDDHTGSVEGGGDGDDAAVDDDHIPGFGLVVTLVVVGLFLGIGRIRGRRTDR